MSTTTRTDPVDVNAMREQIWASAYGAAFAAAASRLDDASKALLGDHDLAAHEARAYADGAVRWFDRHLDGRRVKITPHYGIDTEI